MKNMTEQNPSGFRSDSALISCNRFARARVRKVLIIVSVRVDNTRMFKQPFGVLQYAERRTLHVRTIPFRFAPGSGMVPGAVRLTCGFDQRVRPESEAGIIVIVGDLSTLRRCRFRAPNSG